MVAFISAGQLSALSSATGSSSVTGPWLVPDPGIPLRDYVAEAPIDPRVVWDSQPAVRKVVDFIARHIASTPLHVFQRASDTDRVRVTEGPLAALCRQPAGPRTIAYRFWHSIIVDWLVFDRWAALKVPAADGSGMTLVRLPASRFYIDSDWLGRPTGIRVPGVETATRGLEEFVLDPELVLFDHGWSPHGANGTTPMSTLAQTLREQTEAVAYRRGVWKNAGRFPAVLERPAGAEWTDKGRERFIRSWESFKAAGGAAGGTPILEDGMSLKSVDVFSSKDNRDAEWRQLADAEVASHFHIAPELVGARAGTYSNVDAFKQALYSDSLGPYYTPWEQVLNAMLVPDLDTTGIVYVEANVEAKLRGSFETQAQIMSTATGAPWLTRNEARGRANLPALEGGDELVTPLNVIVGGQASPRDSAPPPESLPKGKGVRAKARPSDLGTAKAETAALERALEAFYAKQSREVLAALRDGKARKAPSLGPAFDEDRWNEELSTLLAGRNYRLAQVGAWGVLGKFNPDADGWDAEVMLPWLRKAAGSHAAAVNNAIFARLAEAVTEPEWEESSAEVFDAAGSGAVALAAGIAAEAIGFGGHDAAKVSGLRTKTWQVNSANARPSHAALDGDTVGLDEVFGNGLRWPGDSGGDVDEVAGCTCTVDFSSD